MPPDSEIRNPKSEIELSHIVGQCPKNVDKYNTVCYFVHHDGNNGMGELY